MSLLRTRHEELIEWRRVGVPHETWKATLLPGAIGLVLTACYEPDNYENKACAGYRARVRLRVFGADSLPFESVADSIDDAKELAEKWARSFLEATAAGVEIALAALGPGPWTCVACAGTPYVGVLPDHERCAKVALRHTGIGHYCSLTSCACLKRGHAPPPAEPAIGLDELGGR